MRIQKWSGAKLPLKNDGELTLFFLGAGYAFTKRQCHNNVLIIKGNDHLLIDCGGKCPQALFDLGIPITDIENFLVTHSHSDHIGGLEEACLTNRYIAHKMPTMVINETYEQILWDMSLRGGCAFNEEDPDNTLSFAKYWHVNRPACLAEDYGRETLEANVGSINIKIFRTKHIPDSSGSWESSYWSCGVVIDNRIMYTSDTRFDRELIDTFDAKFNFEYIFHDCQFFSGGVHASIYELNTLPAAIKAKMYLMHYNDNWEDFESKVTEYGFVDLVRPHKFYIFD
jgi:ribonuclease BN (tRNA processing enzyme)